MPEESDRGPRMPDQKPENEAKLVLLRDRIAALPGAEGAAKWSLSRTTELLDLVAAQKGAVDAADVCLLSAVKAKFKASGVSKLSAREKAVAAMQAHLWPKAVPKGPGAVRPGRFRPEPVMPLAVIFSAAVTVLVSPT